MQWKQGPGPIEAVRGPEKVHEVAGISEAHELELKELFEKLGMERNFVELIAEQHKGGFPEARIRRCLKHLGLKRGVLTQGQARLCPLLTNNLIKSLDFALPRIFLTQIFDA